MTLIHGATYRSVALASTYSDFHTLTGQGAQKMEQRHDVDAAADKKR